MGPDKGIHSILLHAWVHMWKFQWLKEKPDADIIQGYVERVLEVYSYIHSWAKMLSLTVLITKEQEDELLFLLCFKVYFKNPHNEKVTLIITDERESYSHFLVLVKATWDGLPEGQVSVRNNRWLNTATHDWQLLPDIWVKPWGRRPQKGQRNRFPCASQLFLWDLYSSINEHHTVIRNMSKSIEILVVQFFYFLNSNIRKLKDYSCYYC